jgi:membrane-associated HD superfamily phosphohydrolase
VTKKLLSSFTIGLSFISFVFISSLYISVSLIYYGLERAENSHEVVIANLRIFWTKYLLWAIIDLGLVLLSICFLHYLKNKLKIKSSLSLLITILYFLILIFLGILNFNNFEFIQSAFLGLFIVPLILSLVILINSIKSYWNK